MHLENGHRGGSQLLQALRFRSCIAVVKSCDAGPLAASRKHHSGGPSIAYPSQLVGKRAGRRVAPAIQQAEFVAEFRDACDEPISTPVMFGKLISFQLIIASPESIFGDADRSKACAKNEKED